MNTLDINHLVLEMVFGGAAYPVQSAEDIPVYCENMSDAWTVHEQMIGHSDLAVRQYYIDALMFVMGVTAKATERCALSAILTFLTPLKICQAALCAKIACLTVDKEGEEK